MRMRSKRCSTGFLILGALSHESLAHARRALSYARAGDKCGESGNHRLVEDGFARKIVDEIKEHIELEKTFFRQQVRQGLKQAEDAGCRRHGEQWHQKGVPQYQVAPDAWQKEKRAAQGHGEPNQIQLKEEGNDREHFGVRLAVRQQEGTGSAEVNPGM